MRNDVDIGACRGMIKIRIVAVGKVKEKYFSEAVAEYSKRLSRFCDFSIVEVKEENYDKATPAAIEKILSAEGERIEKSIKGLPVCLEVHQRQNGRRNGRNNIHNRRQLRDRRQNQRAMQR